MSSIQYKLCRFVLMSLTFKSSNSPNIYNGQNMCDCRYAEDTYNQDQRRLTIWSDLNTAGRKGTVRSRPNIHNRQNGRDGRYGDIYGSHLHYLGSCSNLNTEKAEIRYL